MPTKTSCGRMVDDGAIVRPYEARPEDCAFWAGFSVERMRMNDRQMLDEMGIIYDVIDVDLSRLAQGDITVSQSRLDGLDDDQVHVYAECMKNGDVFPEIVVSSNTTNRFHVLSGNHRVAAAKSIGRTHLPGLRVTNLTDAQKLMVVAGANNKHGKSITLDDRKAQACALVEVFGWTQADASREFGIPEHQLAASLQTRKSIARWDRIAASKKMPAHKLSNDRMRLLGRLRSDAAYAVAAWADAHLATKDLESAVTEANRKLNEEESIAIFDNILDRARARAQAAGRKEAAAVGALTVVRRADRAINKLSSEMVRSQTDDEQAETIIHLYRMSTRIQELIDGIG
jgi:ParB-like chromosome segregation protein Spo0J